MLQVNRPNVVELFRDAAFKIFQLQSLLIMSVKMFSGLVNNPQIQ